MGGTSKTTDPELAGHAVYWRDKEGKVIISQESIDAIAEKVAEVLSAKARAYMRKVRGEE